MKKYYNIVCAAYVDTYTLNIIFSDGKSRTVDFEPFLKSSTNPQIRKYLDPNEFLKYEIKNGELMWGDFEMLFPVDQLHEGKIA